MPLPDELTRAVTDGLAAVEHDAHCRLDRPYRARIYVALGPARDLESHQARGKVALGQDYDARSAALAQRGEPGHYRRTHLALLTTRHVLPIWEAVWPDDRWPHELLALAERAAVGSPEEIHAAYIEWRQNRPGVDDFYGEGGNDHPAATCVLESAMQTLLCAVTDERDSDPPNPTPLDNDGDYTSWDTAFYAAIAASGALPDAEANLENDQRRHAFWHWWLTEAVQTAWASVPLDE